MFTKQLCKAILKGYQDQAKDNQTHETNYVYEGEFYDEITNERLNEDRVRMARDVEMQYFRDMHVYDKVPVAECIDRTGNRPIGTMWVDVL